MVMHVSNVVKWGTMLTTVRSEAIPLHWHLAAVLRGRVSRHEVVFALLRAAEAPRAMHVAR